MSYTQSQWDREIGWGLVPDEFKHESEFEVENSEAEPTRTEGKGIGNEF